MSNADHEPDALTRTVDCQCGGVRMTLLGPPMRVSVCHCLACQKRSGSAFGVQARYSRDRVWTTGETREFVRIAESGKRVFHQFSPACGTGVSYHLEDAPDVLAVPVGLFGDSSFDPPRLSVYEGRKLPWVEICGESIARRED